MTVAADTVAAIALGSMGYLPSTADVPTLPIPPLRSLLEDAVSAARREMTRGLPNQLPTAKPVQLHEFVTGEVVGDLLPSDVNGDSLTYQVVQGPTNGRIVVNPNGTYAYTPTSDFAKAGGVDTFVVAIDDGHQGQTVIPVNVAVAPALGLSRNFYFRNYTLAPLKFTGYHGTTGDLDSGPAIGTVILPGQEYKWEVTYYFFDSGSVTPQFATVGFGATPSDAGYIPPDVGGTYQASFVATGYEGRKSVYCSAGGGGVCNTSGDNLAVALDKAGTVVTLSSTDANKVASVLPAICYDGSDASCSYKAKSEVSGFTPSHPVGASVANETEKSTTYSIAISDQVSQTDNVSVSAKFSGGQLAKLASIINVEITATYGHSWTNTHTFTQTLNVPVDPGYVSQVYASEPVWKVTGDFVITLGNSTYKLTDATFDTPNPNGVPAYVISTKPIKKLTDGTATDL